MKVLDFKSKRNAIIGFVWMFAFTAVLISCSKKDEIKSSECEIVSFTVDGVEWDIYNKEITYAYPPETEEISMRPTITLSPGATVSPESGMARNFFTNEGITYTVTAEDGVTKKIYTVKATRTKSAACEIVSFIVNDVEWEIDGTDITHSFSSGTTAGYLTPRIILSPGATVSPESDVAHNFFTDEGVTYTVTAENGVKKKTYTVKATIRAVASGATGKCKWTITGSSDDYTMTISGNGAMADYNGYDDQSDSSPWYAYKSEITTIVIQQGVTYVGDFAFFNCINATGTLTIPNSVISIGDYAFANCQFTGTLNIPNSVKFIGIAAFGGCNGFSGALTIPNGMTYIEPQTFWGCSGLTGTLSIPNSVTYIGEEAFYGCYNITGTLSIPNSVTSIGEEAFYGCLSLNNLIIPSSVGTIGEGAFSYCMGLTSITNQRTTPQSINSNVFINVSKTGCKLKVPAASVSAYKAATGWKEFTNIEAY
jgi:hypothetical protein